MGIVNKECLFHLLIKAGAWAAGPALVRADSWLTASPGPFISLFFSLCHLLAISGFPVLQSQMPRGSLDTGLDVPRHPAKVFGAMK